MATLPWRSVRRTVQVLAFILFTAMVVRTATAPTGALTARGLLSLDPLAGLAAMLASRQFLTAFVSALVLLFLTVVLGRFWCGWLCPLGSVIDWTSPESAGRTLPAGWRALKYGLLGIVVVGAALGSLTLLVLDPLTLFVRTLTLAVLPGLQWLVTQLQTALYRTEVFAGLADAMDSVLRPGLLSYRQPVMQGVWITTLLLGGILLLNRLAPRAWCRYLCPLGGLLGLVSKGAWHKRRVGPGCVGCGACERGCPMGTVDAGQDYASDSGECIQCLECLTACPKGVIDEGGSRHYDWGHAYDPGRRQVLGMLGVGLAGVALAGVTPDAHSPQPYRLRPPGAAEDYLLSTCLRCGACMRGCPTHGLQPALGEAGLTGFATPLLVPRLGPCDYACTTCGQICPTGAIPLLTLDQKRLAPLGKAYIDRELCLAWSGRASCIVCEEMCPLPDKAITLDQVQITDASGADSALQVPVVLHERCIGCGLCENRCPINGDAAIRVRVDPMA